MAESHYLLKLRSPKCIGVQLGEKVIALAIAYTAPFFERKSVESLYLLIPIAMVIVAIAVAVFFWAVKSGQYDDLDTEGHRILFDDPPEPPAQHKPTIDRADYSD